MLKSLTLNTALLLLFLLSTLTCKWRDACVLLPPAMKQWRITLRAAMQDQLDETISPGRFLSDSSNTGDESLCLLLLLLVSTLADGPHSRGTTWFTAQSPTPPSFSFRTHELK